jgi:soluble lytic murein transglycosylase
MHGGNLIYKALIFSLLLTSTMGLCAKSGFKKTNSKTKLVSVQKFLKNRMLNISKRDLRAANHIQTVQKLSLKNYYNAHILRKAKKSIVKSSTFYPYRSWIITLNRVNNSKSFAKLSRYCDLRVVKRTHLEKKLNSSIKKFCNTKFLQLLAKSVNKSNRFSVKQMSYLSSNMNEYIFGNNRSNFITFLKKIKGNSRVHKFISFKTTEFLIQSRKVPNKSIIAQMNITPTLTRFIQLKGLDKNSTQNIFFNELNLMSAKLYSDFEDRSSSSNIVKSIKGILNFSELNQSYLPSKRTYSKLSAIGKFLSRRNYLDEARYIFQFIKRQNIKLTKKSQFNILWTYLLNNDHSLALDFINREKILANIDQYDEKMIFWTCYILEKNSKEKQLNSVVKTLIKINPLSFYSIMASKFTPNINYYNNLLDIREERVLTTKAYTKSAIRSLKRIKIWSSLKANSMISLEISSVTKQSNRSLVMKRSSEQSALAKNNLLLVTSNILNSRKDYLQSFKTIYKALSQNKILLNKQTLNLLFPKPFLKRLKYISKKTDPLVLLSLIRQESGFNPKARSHVGARGLMQLMPATARHVSNIKRTKRLNNPNTNMRVGTKYFNYLMDKYENNLIYTLSAYNAGESRVKRWQKKFFKNNSTLHTIESIPFQETRKYVQLIYRNIFFYKLLTGKKGDEISFPNKIYKVSLNN